LREAAVKICLVVDDSRVVRKVARRILEGLDFEIAEAGDGMEALVFCRAAMPDAILLDWAMPVMDGLEFVRRLRAEPGGEAPVVVFCTSENEPDRIAEALDGGADEYIMKPFDGDIIEAKFAQAGLL
jgi:two-component system chemotaxis response regulator CheY